ncbi:protealysin inhibitor emfourin [Microbacterium aureliae]
MTDPATPGNDDSTDAAASVEVDVVRTGGFAGLRRAWHVVASDDADVARWSELVARCPWDAGVDEKPAADGADRFTWRIRARCHAEPERVTDLGESQVVGAWRDLVDEARAWPATADRPVSG